MSENASTFHFHVLPNGLRVVIERMPGVRSAAAGFLARAGADWHTVRRLIDPGKLVETEYEGYKFYVRKLHAAPKR